jgi:catechol 2,3-dioxygenase-like lactoylglutathione lyase family enzyme
VAPILRVARPCSNLGHARRFYCNGLGLEVLAEFADHAGFDGLIVGERGAAWHLELVREHGAAVARPSAEDLIVLYEPEPARYTQRLARLQAAGFVPVPAHNPYWDANGTTFEGPDGYRATIVRRAWPV